MYTWQQIYLAPDCDSIELYLSYTRNMWQDDIQKCQKPIGVNHEIMKVGQAAPSSDYFS